MTQSKIPQISGTPIKRVFAVLKQSLKSKHQDFTQGSISMAVILLAIPMVLELSLESVFAVVDMFFVSKLGPNAIATVGLTESVITIVYSLAIGLSTAATAMVARRIGEKDPEAAAHAGAQALLIALAATVIVSIAGVIFADDILILMGASAEVARDGAVFTRILLGGSLAIMLLFLINILLCPILIHFLGLKGAAIATVIGRSSGVIYQSYHLFKGSGILEFHARHFAWDSKIIRSLVRIAWPATLQFLIGSGSWIILVRLVAETGGTNASAGVQIAFRSFIFFMLPAWGLSNAAATLVGQNLGAKHTERAEQSVYLTAKYSAILMSFVMLLFIFFSGLIIGVFTEDTVVTVHGVQALRIIGSGFIFYSVGMVRTQALNGAGDTRTPTVINFLCFWVFQIPLAYYLSKKEGWGSTAALAAIPAAHAFIALLGWYVFYKGSWKKVKV